MFIACIPVVLDVIVVNVSDHVDRTNRFFGTFRAFTWMIAIMVGEFITERMLHAWRPHEFDAVLKDKGVKLTCLHELPVFAALAALLMVYRLHKHHALTSNAPFMFFLGCFGLQLTIAFDILCKPAMFKRLVRHVQTASNLGR